MKKKPKNRSDPWLGKIILLIVVCVIALYVVTLIVPDEPAICRTVDPSLTIRVTTTTELPDQKAILLGSIERIRSANIYLMITLGETAKIGSGTIIDADDLYYYAITNAHVLDGADVPESRRSIRTAEGILSGFEILVQDDARDLALIRFSKEGRAEILPLPISDPVEVDDPVLAIGNPLGEIGTVSIGSVLGFGTIDHLGIVHSVIVHSATIGSGSSGGALTDIHGNLIGINTWSLDGNYYAIPAEVIQSFIASQNI